MQSDAWESVGILIPFYIVKMLSSRCLLVARTLPLSTFCLSNVMNKSLSSSLNISSSYGTKEKVLVTVIRHKQEAGWRGGECHMNMFKALSQEEFTLPQNP